MPTDLSPQEIETLLANSYYGHLACHDGEDLYLVPITFAFKGGALYAYTHDGKKVDMMRKNPKVCVQTEKVDSKGGWESVIVWGKFEELEGAHDAHQAMIALADSFAKFNDVDHPMVSPLIREISEFQKNKTYPVVYKITIAKSTGRSQSA